MEKENGLEDKQINETPLETSDSSEAKEGMTNRGALELAFQDIKEKEVKAEVEKPVKEPVETKVETVAGPTISKFQPPAEWDKEAKEDFLNSTPKQQEATLRLYHGRITKLSDIQKASAELESLKTLSDSMNPYLKALGVKESTPVAIQKALTMWKEFEYGDPEAATIAYLKAKGKEELAAILESKREQSEGREDISPLQQRLDAVEQKLVREEQARSAAIAQQIWSSFETTKNAAGKNKYPDINESESGLALARYIGSLVSGTTDFSKQFIALVQSRIPDCTPERLLEEAYKIGGGKVDDSSLPARSTNPQEHLKKSNRAASSIPGQGSLNTINGNGIVKKFKDRREAAAHALAEIREREGV